MSAGVLSAVPVIKLISTGLKVGKELPKADLYIDCRPIANPFHNPKLGAMSGDAEIVQAWVEDHAPGLIKAFEEQIQVGLTSLAP